MKTRKPFNKAAHASNDAIGKQTVLKLLKSMDVEAEENSNPYGVDILLKKGIGSYEVERRSIWVEDWPFATVHIPERKTKFLIPEMTYAVVNKDCDKVMLCSSETILKYEQLEVPNKAVATGEYFYDVPLKEWTVHDVG